MAQQADQRRLAGPARLAKAVRRPDHLTTSADIPASAGLLFCTAISALELLDDRRVISDPILLSI
jgi:hypothetical protein